MKKKPSFYLVLFPNFLSLFLIPELAGGKKKKEILTHEKKATSKGLKGWWKRMEKLYATGIALSE